jgi:hypothetical protein
LLSLEVEVSVPVALLPDVFDSVELSDVENVEVPAVTPTVVENVVVLKLAFAFPNADAKLLVIVRAGINPSAEARTAAFSWRL